MLNLIGKELQMPSEAFQVDSLVRNFYLRCRARFLGLPFTEMFEEFFVFNAGQTCCGLIVQFRHSLKRAVFIEELPGIEEGHLRNLSKYTFSRDVEFVALFFLEVGNSGLNIAFR